MCALHDDTWIEPINRNRSLLAAQTWACLAPELSERTPSAAADLVALVDSIMSPEVYDLMTKFHAPRLRQLSGSWTHALRSLITPPVTVPVTVPVTTPEGVAS